MLMSSVNINPWKVLSFQYSQKMTSDFGKLLYKKVLELIEGRQGSFYPLLGIATVFVANCQRESCIFPTILA